MLTPGQIVFLEGLGASIGVALARREAGEKLRAHEERLRSLASEFSLAEERERRRIAVGLHDNITQDLIAMKTRFDSCSRHKTVAACDECVNKTRELVQNSISELRTLTFELGSPVLYEFGLVAALDEMVGEFQEKHGIRSEFEDDGKAKPLGPDLGALVFRAVRELLVNVVKHAEADRVTVSTIRDDQSLKVVVEDDGIGFDTAEAARAAARSGAFGLFGVRERLEYLGGGMRLESEPGRGARVILVVPLKDEPPFAPSELRRAPSSIALAKEDERDADAEGGR
jgi:signal transduction histidine kinase